MKSAIFFDRDGIVNRRRIDDYVKTWSEFEFLPEIFTVLPASRRSGHLAVLVTNQRGIARGLMSEDALLSMHDRMQTELDARTGARFDAIYFCPHDRDSGCNCRKPLPGMLIDAARDLDIDLRSSWLIGDSESDVAAAHAAGARAVLVAEDVTESAAEAVVATLADAWSFIVSQSKRDIVA